jgi:hypothetical protein
MGLKKTKSLKPASSLPQTTNGTAKKVERALHRDLEPDYRSIINGSRQALSEPAAKFSRYAVDPRGEKGARPTIYRGFVQKSSLIELKTEFDFNTGTGGYGLITVSPNVGGPFSNTTPILATGPTYTGGSGSLLPGGTGVGIVSIGWGNAPYAAPLSEAELQYRCVACAVYVFPIGSISTMKGALYMLEAPGHSLINTGNTVGNIIANPLTRALRGAQVGDPSQLNVLNWHMMGREQLAGGSGVSATMNDDVAFRNMASLSVSQSHSDLQIIIEGGIAPLDSTSYHVEVYCGYELIGTAALSPEACMYDTRSWDLLRNVWACKTLSGWVGTPRQAVDSYDVAVSHKKKEMETGNRPADKSFGWRDLIDVGREVAGLLL